MSRFTVLCASFAALLTLAAPVTAQATRTWVSGVGDNVNPCCRTAPCKTFAGAISKTAAGGETSVLDPAGFGAVTITKSIGIVAESNEGSILASMTSVSINAGPNDTVLLHGLFIDGAGASIQINRSMITQNGVGLANRNGGQIASFGNNAIVGDTQDGAPAAKLQP
jgi:hypothetical protein